MPKSPEMRRSPEPTSIPEGLTQCPDCLEYRGQTRHYGNEITVSCLCEGIICSSCQQTRIHRPISSYFDEKTGHIIHVSWLSTHCLKCR